MLGEPGERQAKPEPEQQPPPLSLGEIIREKPGRHLRPTLFTTNPEEVEGPMEGLRISYAVVGEGDESGLPAGVYAQLNIRPEGYNMVRAACILHITRELGVDRRNPPIIIEAVAMASTGAVILRLTPDDFI